MSRLAKHELMQRLKGDPKSIYRVAMMLLPGTPSLLNLSYWERRLAAASKPFGWKDKVSLKISSAMMFGMSRMITNRLDWRPDRNIIFELAASAGLLFVRLFFLLPTER